LSLIQIIYGKDRLTEPSLIDLSGREGEDRQQFDHDLDYYFRHRGRRRNLGINHEASEEILDAFKDVDEGVIARPHILGRLVDRAIAELAGQSGEDTHGKKNPNAGKNCPCRREHLQ
jgi:hypothetical protein